MPFDIHIVTITHQSVQRSENDTLLLSSPDKLFDLLGTFSPISSDLLVKINAAIQRVFTIKPPRRRVNIKKDDSRGAIIKRIEQEIANLDQWQKSGAIEFPEGVQRIRGLAGSGKTVVLALKAAYLHALHPTWRIVVTFHTRALYPQFIDLIRRFTFEHTNDEPDFNYLKIIHAWGSFSQAGVYSEIATEHGITPKDFSYGRNKYSYESAFEGICTELIDEIGEDKFRQIYDVVLIDEAQDFPHSFFELVWLATKQPKRIIYAYDELQNLGDYHMAPPSELFGYKADDQPRVPQLNNVPKEPRQDITLPICYRNTPWALTVAHSLGFGIYRKEGLVQFFDDPELLLDVGYQVTDGELALGRSVSLKREPRSAPNYFYELLSPNDALVCQIFENKDEQAKELAKAIQKNLNEDELEHRDIIVILPDPLTTQREAALVIKELSSRGIPAHIAGVTSSRDELFQDDSIALTHIYRAKGNEAAMVYILNSEYGYRGYELNKRRSILFTAITRSKAWVRLFGCGLYMQNLINEVDAVIANNYHLRFKVPTQEELNRLRKIHKDMTREEKDKIRKLEMDARNFLNAIESGDIAFENLSTDLIEKLEALFKSEEANDSHHD